MSERVVDNGRDSEADQIAAQLKLQLAGLPATGTASGTSSQASTSRKNRVWGGSRRGSLAPPGIRTQPGTARPKHAVVRLIDEAASIVVGQDQLYVVYVGE